MELKDYTTEELKAELKRRAAEEKAKKKKKEYSDRHKSIENSYFKGYNYNIAEKYDAEKFAYEAGASDQKAIDLETVCNIFCHTGCPHKTDSYDCLKDKCDALKAFKRMMAE